MQAKNGSNIVQAGNGGNLISKLIEPWTAANKAKITMALQDRYLEKQTEEHGKRQSALTTEMNKRNAFKAVLPAYAQVHAHEMFTETYGEDHPDVVSGKKVAGEPLRPELTASYRARGLAGSQIASESPGERQEAGRQKTEQEKQRTLAMVRENADFGAWQKMKNGGSEGGKIKNPQFDASAAVASSPVKGWNPEENDIQSALNANNQRNLLPFTSTAGESGNWTPTKFEPSGQPTFSENDAEELRSISNQSPNDTRDGFGARATEQSRLSNLNVGTQEGK